MSGNLRVYPLKFIAVYKEKVWGGQRLKSILCKKMPENIPVGEIWEIVDRDNDASVVENGVFAGKNIREVICELGTDLLGTAKKLDSHGRFPLLIKHLDSSDKLSVQVHPDDRVAEHFEEQDTGKTEMWYIHHAEPGSKIIYGCDPDLKNINPNQGFRKEMERLLHYISVDKGDLIYIPSGQVHALLGGCVVLEIQQNSDLTYRLYDWGRMGLDGKSRELHLEKAVAAIKTRKPPNCHQKILNIREERSSLIHCDYFNADLLRAKNSIKDLCDGSSFKIFAVIEGNGKLAYGQNCNNILPVNKGDIILLPASLGEFRIDPENDLAIISVS